MLKDFFAIVAVLACLEKLGIIKHSDLLPTREIKEDPELNESDDYDLKTANLV